MHTRTIIQSTLMLCCTALLISIPATELSAQTEQDLVTSPSPPEERDHGSPHPDSTSIGDADEGYILPLTNQEAKYPGGLEQLFQDFSENFVYPKKARKAGKEGRMIIQFIVTTDGSVSNIQVKKKLGYGLEEAAIFAIEHLQKFSPALENGKPSISVYTLPIQCKIK